MPEFHTNHNIRPSHFFPSWWCIRWTSFTLNYCHAAYEIKLNHSTFYLDSVKMQSLSSRLMMRSAYRIEHIEKRENDNDKVENHKRSKMWETCFYHIFHLGLDCSHSNLNLTWAKHFTVQIFFVCLRRKYRRYFCSLFVSLFVSGAFSCKIILRHQKELERITKFYYKFVKIALTEISKQKYESVKWKWNVLFLKIMRNQ